MNTIKVLIVGLLLSPIIFTSSLFAQGNPTGSQNTRETKVKSELEEKERRKSEKQAVEQAERDRKEKEKEAKSRVDYEKYRPINKQSSYDKFKDLTSFVMDKMLVVGRDQLNSQNGGFVSHGVAEIGLTGGFHVVGQNWKKPDQVIFQFEALQANWEYLPLNRRGLILLVDGERMNLGTTGYEQFNVRSIGNLEKLFATISYENFVKISNAKTVDVQLGRFEFSLEPRHLEGLRNLVAEPK